MKKIFLKLLALMALLPVVAMAEDPTPDLMPYSNQTPQNPVNMTPDLYSGRVNVQIPLATISTDGLNIPIALTYITSGIKVEDMASWVGLGWNLTGDGKISKVIRGGGSDNSLGGKGYTKYSPGYSYKNGYYAGWSPDDPASEWTVRNRFGERLYGFASDFEPDLYYFQLPGGASGMFVCDYNGIPHTIPYQNIKIEPHDTYNTGFTITDQNGIRYIFGDLSSFQETSWSETGSSSNNNHSHTSCLYIRKIEKGNRTIVEYSYTAGSNYWYESYNHFKYFSKLLWSSSPFTWGSHYSLDHRYGVNSPKYLSRIKWAGGVVDFQKKGGRNDKPELPLLDFFTVKDAHNQLVKKVSFQYGTFPPRNAPYLYRIYNNYPASSDYPNGRQEEICHFEYNTATQIPADRNTFDVDTWGYYNCAGNVLRYPPIYVNGTAATSLGGATKTSNFAGAKANILTRIHYPSGSYTEFVYEQNYGKMPWGSSFLYVYPGGIRIQKIIESENASSTSRKYEKTYSYVLANGQSSGEVFRTNPVARAVPCGDGGIYGINERYPYASQLTDINGLFMSYSRVRETLPDGSSNIYEFYPYSNCPDIDTQCQLVVQGRAMSVPYVEYVTTSRAWGRGMLKRLYKYRQNGELVSATTYNYNFNLPDKATIYGAVLRTAPERPASQLNCYLGQYSWSSKPVVLQEVVNEKTNYQQYSKTEYTYDQTYMVPTQIRQFDQEDNLTETTIKYPFSYTSANTSNPYRKMVDDNIITPIETVVCRVRAGESAKKVVSGTLNRFDLHFRPAFYPAGVNIALPHSTCKLAINDPVPVGNFTPSYLNGSGQLVFDSRYKVTETCDHYDVDNNRVSTVHAGEYGLPQSFLYDANGNVTAQVSNAVIRKAILTYADTIEDYSDSYDEGHAQAIFDIPFGQQVPICISIYLPNFPNVHTFSGVHCAITQLSGDSGFSSISEELTQNSRNFTANMPTGQYKISVTSGPDDMAIQIEWSICYRSIISVEKFNQVFHTSFENETGAIQTPKAKTGRYVYSGQYAANVADLQPGTYRLTYWKSTDSGNSWVKMSQTVSIAATAQTLSVGGSYWIDEVRIMPAGAQMATFTYCPYGKTSEMDNNGHTQYWEYDGLGRLFRILNNDRQVVKEYRYNIKQQ
ncbi:hypothetical protein FACS1894159_09950 [Bacteroidia bacterium]|nr:hypothetical protein FACS1894159_09950 [Bacteroidia bacterium]